MSSMWWLFAILISVSLGAVSVILQRSLLKNDESDPVVYSVVFQVVISILLTGYGWATTTMDFSGVWQLWPQWLVLITLYGFGNVAVFSSLKKISAGEFQLIFALRALFTVLSSWVVLSQPVSIKQWLGIVLIGWSVWLVSERKTEAHSSQTGVMLGVVAAACFGLANTNDAVMLQQLPLMPFLSLAFLLPALSMIFIYYRKFLQPVKIFQTLRWKKLGLMSLLYGIAAIFFFSALTTAPQIAPVVTINQVQIILVVILGAIFLKERTGIRVKALAAGLSVIGSWLVI